MGTTNELEALKQKHQDLLRQQATKEGELGRLKEEETAAKQALLDLGIEQVDDAEGEIARLEREVEEGEVELKKLLGEAERVLNGESVVGETDDDL